MAEGRKTVPVTGGAGTIGRAFIERHRGEHGFVNLGRGGADLRAPGRRFPEIRSFVRDVDDADRLIDALLDAAAVVVGTVRRFSDVRAVGRR